MQETWRQGEMSVREVMDAVNDHGGRRRAYTTYMAIMARLHGKRLLERRRDGRTDFFRPVDGPQQYADLCARAANPLSWSNSPMSHALTSPRRWHGSALNAADPLRALPARRDVCGRQAFPLGVGLGAAGLLSCAAMLAAMHAAVHRASGASAQILVAGLRFTYPSVNTAAALLGVLAGAGAVALTAAVRAARRQWWRYRRFLARLGPAEPFERDPRVRVIKDPRPQAFCAGYARPTVYISRRTVEMLSEAELDAVLAHEHHHRRGHDPLRVACGRIMSGALFFLPVLDCLSDRCADEAELCGDRAAIRASGGQTAPLASALLAFEERAPTGASGISPERVDAPLGQSIPWRPPIGRLFISLFVPVGDGRLLVAAQRAGVGTGHLQPAPSLLENLSRDEYGVPDAWVHQPADPRTSSSEA